MRPNNLFHRRLVAIAEAVAKGPQGVIKVSTEPTPPDPAVQNLAEHVEEVTAGLQKQLTAATEAQKAVECQLKCLVALFEVTEIIWSWDDDNHQSLNAELRELFALHDESMKACIGDGPEINDWQKLCAELPTKTSGEAQHKKRQQRFELARTVRRALVARRS